MIHAFRRVLLFAFCLTCFVRAEELCPGGAWDLGLPLVISVLLRTAPPSPMDFTAAPLFEFGLSSISLRDFSQGLKISKKKRPD